MLRVINADTAPAAIGPYVQAIEASGFLFVSGQIPLDPKSGQLVGKTAAEQARRVLESLHSIVDASRACWNSVVRVTIYLTDLAEFANVNEVYAEFFSEHKPTRACVEVSRLPKDVLVEMDLVAAIVS